MNQLYPLRFKPYIVERIWGGTRLKSLLNKKTGCKSRCGESWEISAVGGHISVVDNGFLKGNNLQELIKIYMDELVGEKVFGKFGVEFPLLIKFIDAEDDLSIQVHPGDRLSEERHKAYGKTEMWYVLDASPGARLSSGFNQPVNKEKYLEYLESGRLPELLNFMEVYPGDAFFIPAGRIHAIGKGILVAEIQQTSDVTYRIFDYDRTDSEGRKRELHNALAIGAIDFNPADDYRTSYTPVRNKSSEIVACPYFTTNILEIDQPIEKEYSQLDSFIIYLCTEGECSFSWEGGVERINLGETLLIPACMDKFVLSPEKGYSKLLEVFIP